LRVAADLLSCDIENSILLDDKDDVCAHFFEMGGHSICVRSVDDTIVVLDELVRLCDAQIQPTANQIITELKRGTLPNVISWADQVRTRL